MTLESDRSANATFSRFFLRFFLAKFLNHSAWRLKVKELCYGAATVQGPLGPVHYGREVGCRRDSRVVDQIELEDCNPSSSLVLGQPWVAGLEKPTSAQHRPDSAPKRGFARPFSS